MAQATHSSIFAWRIPWRATVPGVAKSWTRLSDRAHTCIPNWPPWACLLGGCCKDQLSLKVQVLSLPQFYTFLLFHLGSPCLAVLEGPGPIPRAGDRAMNLTLPCSLAGDVPGGWQLSGWNPVRAQLRGAEPSPKLAVTGKASQRNRFQWRPET